MSTGPVPRFESQAELSSIIDALATATVVLDKRQCIAHLNPAAESLLSVSLDRARGRDFFQLISGNDEYRAELQSVRAGGVPTVRRELRLTVANGETRIVDCRASLMEPGQHGDLLLELLDAEPRLRINREVAQLAQQSVSRNISRQLAHEIKNPLGGLRGAAQLLERQLESPDQKAYTRVIIEEADRLTNLVNTMLGPHQPLERRLCNVHKLTQRVHSLLKSEAAPGISIVEDYDPSLPELMLDGDAITQAFLNIGRNAIQILHAGGTLRLRTRVENHHLLRGKRHATVARIDFEDDGPGVADEVRETLFYPLITARPGGTGLGLALAQELVNRHDGLVQLRSAGSPTIFSAYLPVEHQ